MRLMTVNDRDALDHAITKLQRSAWQSTAPTAFLARTKLTHSNFSPLTRWTHSRAFRAQSRARQSPAPPDSAHRPRLWELAAIPATARDAGSAACAIRATGSRACAYNIRGFRHGDRRRGRSFAGSMMDGASEQAQLNLTLAATGIHASQRLGICLRDGPFDRVGIDVANFPREHKDVAIGRVQREPSYDFAPRFGVEECPIVHAGANDLEAQFWAKSIRRALSEKRQKSFGSS